MEEKESITTGNDLAVTHIYHASRSNTVVEPLLLQTLMNWLPNVRLHEENYRLDASYLDKLVDTQFLVRQITASELLPKKRRDAFVTILSTLPRNLKVAQSSSKISCDFVIKKNGNLYYWELHEEQHQTLRGGMRKGKEFNVYTPDGEPISVPRGLQRLVRDVWRVQNVRPFTIIWADWFLANQTSFRPSLREGFHEFCIDGRFSFGSFCTST